jgi:peptide/nickel transport system substrate-binding protein
VRVWGKIQAAKPNPIIFKENSLKISRMLILLVLASVLLAACQTGQTTPLPPGPGQTQAISTPDQPATATATASPRSLVVCVGQEPQTLYRYGGSARSMWSGTRPSL